VVVGECWTLAKSTAFAVRRGGKTLPVRLRTRVRGHLGDEERLYEDAPFLHLLDGHAAPTPLEFVRTSPPRTELMEVLSPRPSIVPSQLWSPSLPALATIPSSKEMKSRY